MSVFGKIPYCYQIRMGLFFLKRFGFGTEQLRILVNYMTGKLFSEQGDEKHLRAAVEWLDYAQDVSNDSGVPSLFSLSSGWGVSYPETSGYILVTYLAYADYCGDKSYMERAVAIGDWEIDIQAPNGGVFSSTALKQTRVFNTGQVILGWCVLFERTGDERYLKAATRAGDYLLNEQEEDGTWKRDTYCGARTYHSRVDWALLRLFQLSGIVLYRDAAIRNLRWVLAQQTETGWFNECGFNDALPIMHVIIYTLRGLLECHLVGDEGVRELDIMASVIKSADALCHALQQQPVACIDGMVPTAFDKNWKGNTGDSCLTGNSQLACFLYRLSHFENNELYRETADEVLSATKRTQLVQSSFAPVKGAIAGSYPMYRGYLSNAYPNWATKFFADALLMKINYEKKLVIPA